MDRKKILAPLVIATMILSVNFRSDSNLISSYKKLDGNQVSTYFSNRGIFNSNFATGNAGFEWPGGSEHYLRYRSNVILGAVSGNDTIVSYGGEFEPGHIDDNGDPQGINDPLYRVYKIVRGDTTSEDYNQWPSNQGAYVNSNGKPFLIGEQTLFSSYSDGYVNSDSPINLPLKAQILETDWVFNFTGPVANTVFTEFRIINRSSVVWNNFYTGIYSDDDVGNATDDVAMPDSIRRMGYTYNATNLDAVYGMAPPAISFSVLYGLDQYTGISGDSSVIYRPPSSGNRIAKYGYRNLYITAFSPFLNSVPAINSPANDREYYNVLQGLKTNGNIWTNIGGINQTRFPKDYFGPGDYKFAVSSGPVNVNPGDTVTFTVAQIAARGVSYLSSVSELRTSTLLIRDIFENNFSTVSINDPGISNIPDEFELDQNYPNPFNPSTNLEFGISKSGFVTLKIYDLLGKEIQTLVSETMPAGRYTIKFDGSNLSSGIYFYKLTVNNLSAVLKMVLQK